MVISARFSSLCPTCSQRIEIGAQVTWSRGEKAAHVECPPAPIAGASDLAPNARERGLDIEAEADALLNEYDAQQQQAAQSAILKGIYRVSLTGSERRYGVDCVNLSLIPNEKYGSIKVGEWQGESIGRVNRDGSFAFWPSFEDRTATRTYALLAALDIVRGSADPFQFAKAYAAESQTCWRCGADLVDEQSRERLLGPTCFRAVNKGA